MKTFDEISDELTKNENVKTVSMATLRDAAGAGKLGKYVRERIAQELNQRGISYISEAGNRELPEYQEQSVRIYRVGTAVGKLIDAVTTMGTRQDEIIKQATQSKPSEVLERIKALVCDD